MLKQVLTAEFWSTIHHRWRGQPGFEFPVQRQSDAFNEEGISIVFPEVPVPGCTNPSADSYNRLPTRMTVLVPCGGLCIGFLAWLHPTPSAHDAHLCQFHPDDVMTVCTAPT